MRSEWRTNLWMAIELLLVSVVLFVLADKIYTVVATLNEPLGYDTEHCYILKVRELSEAAPDYKKYESEDDRYADLLSLKSRIIERPEIASATMSSNAHPYNRNNSMIQVSIDTFSMSDSPFIQRTVDPDFFKVFRITGANGESPEELGDVLKKELVIVSDNALRLRYGIESLVGLYGKHMAFPSGDTIPLRTSFKPLKYSDYSSIHGWSGRSMFQIFNRYYLGFMEGISVRVNDNMDHDFIERLMTDADRHLRVGNWYVASVESFGTIKEEYNRSSEAETRNTVVCALFLLFNIFLGILGTYWFRTQQRVREIALRMVSGAGRGDVFRRIFGEGQLLLLIVTPAAIIIDYLLAKNEFTTWYVEYFEPVRFCASVLIAWGLMAAMISVGTYFPARRAMRVSAAEALKSE